MQKNTSPYLRRVNHTAAIVKFEIDESQHGDVKFNEGRHDLESQRRWSSLNKIIFSTQKSESKVWNFSPVDIDHEARSKSPYSP